MPNISELILVQEVGQIDGYLATLFELLARFLQLRHDNGTSLQVLRHDLCSKICGGGGATRDAISVEAFAYMVEREICCTNCGKTARKGAVLNFLRLDLEILLTFKVFIVGNRVTTEDTEDGIAFEG